MAEVTVALLGLGRVGASMGLALKRYGAQGKEHTFKITGYDSTPDNVKAAKTLKAIDESAPRPEMAVKDKDIVVINLPYGEVPNAYEFIAPQLRPGAVILDSSPLTQTSMAWAKKHLPEDAHLVCIKPILNSKYLFNPVDRTEDAVEDLFDNGIVLLMPSVTCIKEAISLATEFSRIIGSRQHFLDPAEHDGLIAGTEILPGLLGSMYFYMMSNSSGWLDLQRMANPTFGGMTHPLFDTHPDDMRDEIMNSRDNLLRYLDEMLVKMRDFRQILADEDRDALEAVLSESSKEYEQWINRRYNNRWQDDEMLDSSSPGIGGMMSNMMGGFFGGFNRNDDKDDKK